MSAVITLTDMERAQARKSVFMSKRTDKRFVLEALGECDDSWHRAHLNADSLAMHRAIDQAVWDYCEWLGYFKDAEQDLLDAIGRDGGRKLA